MFMVLLMSWIYSQLTLSLLFGCYCKWFKIVFFLKNQQGINFSHIQMFKGKPSRTGLSHSAVLLKARLLGSPSGTISCL